MKWAVGVLPAMTFQAFCFFRLLGKDQAPNSPSIEAGSWDEVFEMGLKV